MEKNHSFVQLLKTEKKSQTRYGFVILTPVNPALCTLYTFKSLQRGINIKTDTVRNWFYPAASFPFAALHEPIYKSRQECDKVLVYKNQMLEHSPSPTFNILLWTVVIEKCSFTFVQITFKYPSISMFNNSKDDSIESAIHVYLIH